MTDLYSHQQVSADLIQLPSNFSGDGEYQYQVSEYQTDTGLI